MAAVLTLDRHAILQKARDAYDAMGLRSDFSRWVQCSRKPTKTKSQALAAAARLTAQGVLNMSAYRCDFCRWWHVGKGNA